MKATIYHNPRCGTSRNALALLQEAGAEISIVEYLKTPLSVAQLRALLQHMQTPARTLLRAKEALATELGLLDTTISDDAILTAIAEHPILFNRPVVTTEKGGLVCRPAEKVLELL